MDARGSRRASRAARRRRALRVREPERRCRASRRTRTAASAAATTGYYYLLFFSALSLPAMHMHTLHILHILHVLDINARQIPLPPLPSLPCRALLAALLASPSAFVRILVGCMASREKEYLFRWAVSRSCLLRDYACRFALGAMPIIDFNESATARAKREPRR